MRENEKETTKIPSLNFSFFISFLCSPPSLPFPPPPSLPSCCKYKGGFEQLGAHEKYSHTHSNKVEGSLERGREGETERERGKGRKVGEKNERKGRGKGEKREIGG